MEIINPQFLIKMYSKGYFPMAKSAKSIGVEFFKPYKRFLIPIPFGAAKFQSYFLQMMPNPLLTPDQVEMLKHNNVVSGEYKTLKNLKIKSTTIQSILPKYIYRFRAGGQFG